MKLSTRSQAVLALFIIGILGGVAPIFMKIALKEFTSFQIIFIRFGLALILVAPLLFQQLKKISLKKLLPIIPAGFLFSGNVFLFIIGVQYTTSVVSQLFFLLTPVIVSFFGYLLFRDKVSMRRIVSMGICFGGSSFLILRSIEGGKLVHSIGTLQGNIFILCAVFSWACYVLYVKRLSEKFEPTLFVGMNFLTAFSISIMSFIVTKTSITATITQLGQSSIPSVFSLFALAIVNSVLFFLLYQWSLKHVSAFVVSTTAFLSPLSAAVFAIPFFGEQLSTTLLISAASIFLGSYLILTEKK